MACFESGTVIEMNRREAVTLTDVRGATLRVARGTIWLTQQDDPADIILRVGDNYVVEREGRTVIEAQDEDSLVCVVGRHVEDSSASRSPPAAPYADWRDRVAAALALSTRSFTPYL